MRIGLIKALLARTAVLYSGCGALLRCLLVISCFAGATVAQAQISVPPIKSGQSLTQLADGNWLIIGASTANGRIASADMIVVDQTTGKARPLPARLNIVRTGQTATLLPDGRVLVLGGTGANGAPGLPPEIIDTATWAVTSLPDPGLIARSQHTATLMADGRILITGGLDAGGQPLYDAEILDGHSFASERFNVRTDVARFAHLAQWLPSNAVLLSAGLGRDGQPVANGEIYDAAAYRFAPVTPLEVQRLLGNLTGLQPAILVGSTPAEAAAAVPTDTPIVLRFSKWMNPASLNAQTVTLTGGGQTIKARIVGAERGLLLFVTPNTGLAPNTSYTLAIDGALDASGQPLFAFSRHFQTGNGSANPVTAGANGDGPVQGSAGVPAASANATVAVPTLADAQRLLSSMPLSFEENAGQYPDDVKFTTRGYDYQLMLTSRSAIIALRQPLHKAKDDASDAEDRAPRTRQDRDKQVRTHSSNRHALLRLRFEGANQVPASEGREAQTQRTHYIGTGTKAMPSEGAANFARVLYHGVYPGIDQAYYGNQGRLEYDWLVAPGANPASIVQVFDGAQAADLNAQGDLVLTVGERQVTFKKPVAYQEINGARQPVDVAYSVLDTRKFGFKLGAYDDSQQLIIDPTVVYSTFLGGNGYDYATGVALDSAGNLYVAGTAYSSDFPVTTGAFSTFGEILPITNSLAYDYDREATFVSKFNPAGTSLLFSAFVFDNNLYNSEAAGIAVGSDGGIYVAGRGLYAGYFINGIPAGVSQRNVIPASQYTLVANNMKDGHGSFVYKMAASGSTLNFMTSVPDVNIQSMALDASGYVYIGGSVDLWYGAFATTAGAAQTSLPSSSQPALLAKINPTGTAYVYATYFAGANGQTVVNSVAVDPTGNLYFAGIANGVSSLPVVNAFQSVHSSGGKDGMFGKLNAAGSAFTYASFYNGGTGGTQLNGIAVDWIGNAYLVGSTGAGALRVNDTGFPLYSTMPSGQGAVVAKVDPAGAVTFASTMANTGAAYATAVNLAGDMYVTGYANPGANTLINDLGKGGTGSASDAFVAKIPADSSTPALFALFGGSAADIAYAATLDQGGNLYVAGGTTSTNFPTLNAYQSTFETSSFQVQTVVGGLHAGTPQQAFILKLSDPLTQGVHLSSSLNPATIGQPITFYAAVTGNSPTGSVTFYDGATSLGTVVLINGVASLSTSALIIGNHSITVSYTGDANNPAATSSAVAQVIRSGANAVATTTTLTASVSGLAPINTSAQLTAHVTGSTPTGAVNFTDNGLVFASIPVGSGTVNTTYSGIVSGSHSVVATYVGDIANQPSSSAPVPYNIVAPPTAAVGTPADGTAFTLPATVTLTANIDSNSGGNITLVRFLAGGTEIGRVTSAPYQFSWVNPPVGTSIVTVEATDNFGQVTTSTAINVLVHQAPANGIVTYFYQDLTGSTVAATDDAGQLVYSESYLPYGERINPQLNPDPTRLAKISGNRLWFHGKAQDEATGLSYFGARYYDPIASRFMGIDPVAFNEKNIHSFNRYTYANGNPYRYIDPDGRDTVPFVPYTEKEIEELYRPKSFGPAGHHDALTFAQAKRYRLSITREAMELASRATLGAGYVSRGLEGDPHKGWPIPHRENDAALDKLLDSKKFTPENPMTTENFLKYQKEAYALPEVKSYRESVVEFVNDQRAKGIRPRRWGAAVRSILRGGGAEGGGRGSGGD